MVLTHLLDERLLGIVMLLVMAILVAVKIRATGSLVEWPSGDVLLKAVNVFNLLFLLVANPLAAVLLITRAAATVDPTHVVVDAPEPLVAIRTAGLVMYVTGYGFMAWALVVLGRQYQPGGNAPRPGERMVNDGPYAVVRHPMYAAALLGALGVTFLAQSWGVFCAFCIYLALIPAFVRREEQGLRRAFGEEYDAYRKRVRALVPFVY